MYNDTSAGVADSTTTRNVLDEHIYQDHLFGITNS